METTDYTKELKSTIAAIARNGTCGLLAADESTGTIGKRFDVINVENNFENRQAYRRLLAATPDLGKWISGIILYKETLFEFKNDKGVSLAKVCADKGVVPGIKLDAGTCVVANMNGESITQGLTDLDAYAAKSYAAGARFAKWRNIYNISANGLPSDTIVRENANTLARYAGICIKNGLVPIIEPEVLVLQGNHDIKTALRVQKRVLGAVYKALVDFNVRSDLTILKTNFVLPARSNTAAPKPSDVATATLEAFKATVPADVGAILFLSGGLTEVESTQFLAATCAISKGSPWPIMVSYGRALQGSCLAAWKGQSANIGAAQDALQHRARMNSLAIAGKYTADVEAGK